MSAISAVSANGTSSSPANSFLRDLGLRWDPAGHRWHGTTTTERVRELRERLGLEVRVFGDLAAPPKGPAAPKPAPPGPAPAPIAVSTRDPARRPHDGVRTRVEARVAFPAVEETDEIWTPARRFALWETTSGLPDDSREEDERATERRLRNLRGCVKAARAVVSKTPGLADVLASDWRKAARFCARLGVSESTFRYGVPASRGGDLEP